MYHRGPLSEGIIYTNRLTLENLTMMEETVDNI